jgi:flagellar assembly factor FliW
MKTAGSTEALEKPLQNNDIIELPLGLLGFEAIKEYVWLESPDELPFRWLQARDNPRLTFLVVPPFDVLPAYAPDIGDDDVAFLQLSQPSDALMFGIVTLRTRGPSTVNLKGPIVLNRFTRRGKQVVLVNALNYPLQYPLPVAE